MTENNNNFFLYINVQICGLYKLESDWQKRNVRNAKRPLRQTLQSYVSSNPPRRRYTFSSLFLYSSVYCFSFLPLSVWFPRNRQMSSENVKTFTNSFSRPWNGDLGFCGYLGPQISLTHVHKFCIFILVFAHLLYLIRYIYYDVFLIFAVEKS